MPCGFPGGSASEESACSVGDLGSVPGLRRSPGEANGNPLQHSCLENSMDRGAWGRSYSPWRWQRVRHDWLTKRKHTTARQNDSEITPHRMWKKKHGLVGWTWSLEPDHLDSRPSSAITSCKILDKFLISLGLCFFIFKMTVIMEPYQVK